VGNYKLQSEFQYQSLRYASPPRFPGFFPPSPRSRADLLPEIPTRRRCNVDMLKLIQLGLTLTDGEGNLPMIGNHYCMWQFNFREFSLKEDMYAQDSIALLKHSGIDFKAHEERGIDVHRFGELLMVSGVVLSSKVKWVTFHSGYDFGYLVKLLTCRPLPTTEAEFFHILGLYFPNVFDMKYMMKFKDGYHGGLSKLAEQLDVVRIGPQHQAGSDSLLTACTFFKLTQTHFSGERDLQKFRGVLYGLGADADEA